MEIIKSKFFLTTEDMTCYMSQWSLLTLLLLIFVVCRSFQLQKHMELSENVLVNGDFSIPPVGKNEWIVIPKSVPGWTCTTECQIMDCENYGIWALKNYKIAFANCTGPLIDVASTLSTQLITQLIQLSAGEYLLKLTYFLPTFDGNVKTLQIFFNEQLIFQYQPNIPRDYASYNFQAEVTAVNGINNLSITNQDPLKSPYGFKFGNVSLQRIVKKSFQQFLETAHTNLVITALIGLPASRTIFSILLTSFVNLDRLQLYYYHQRPTSYYSTMLFNATNNLLQTTAQMITVLPGINFQDTQAFKKRFSWLNLKTDHSNPAMLEKTEAGDSFYLNQLDFFLQVIPSITFVFITMALIYWLTSRWRISYLFRRYSCYALFFPMIFEGNVEELTFFLVGELLCFFSQGPVQKMCNLFIVFFLFLLIILSLTSLIWCRLSYGPRIHYFTQNNYAHLSGIFASLIDRFSIAFLFGLTHRLLLQTPDYQLCALACLEIIWIITRVYFYRSNCYKNNLLIRIQILLGISRIFLIVSLYVYAHYPEYRIYINSQIHFVFIIVLFALFTTAFIVGIYRSIRELWKTIIKIRRSNKVTHQPELPQAPKKIQNMFKKQSKKQTGQVKTCMKLYKNGLNKKRHMNMTLQKDNKVILSVSFDQDFKSKTRTSKQAVLDPKTYNLSKRLEYGQKQRKIKKARYPNSGLLQVQKTLKQYK